MCIVHCICIAARRGGCRRKGPSTARGYAPRRRGAQPSSCAWSKGRYSTTGRSSTEHVRASLLNVAFFSFFFSAHSTNHQSRVSLFILYTQAESGGYSRNSSRFPRRRPLIYIAILRHRVSPEFIGSRNCIPVYGVHCRESAGTGQVALKVVPVTGAAFFAGHYGPINVHLSFPTPTIIGMKWL